jgi:ferredoxin-NADP reductase
VRSVDREADDVVSVLFAAPTGEPLPRCAPGEHLELLLPGGMVRHYSVCSAASDDGAWRIAVLREVEGRGGSAYVHDRLRPGDLVPVRGPRTGFALHAGAPAYLFVAGGIGITPILPMVEAVAASGAPWRLVYLARSRVRMAFTARLAAHADAVTLLPDDETGGVDLGACLAAALAELGAAPAATHVHGCGPAGLLSALEDWSAAAGVGGLHVERFTPAPASAAGEAVERGFVVQTADGTEVPVPPDRSVLESLRAAGVPVLSSCGEGVCGTCETAVLAGVPDHRDDLLSDEEKAAGETMLICVSRSRTDRLVLDL